MHDHLLFRSRNDQLYINSVLRNNGQYRKNPINYWNYCIKVNEKNEEKFYVGEKKDEWSELPKMNRITEMCTEPMSASEFVL